MNQDKFFNMRILDSDHSQVIIPAGEVTRLPIESCPEMCRVIDLETQLTLARSQSQSERDWAKTSISTLKEELDAATRLADDHRKHATNAHAALDEKCERISELEQLLTLAHSTLEARDAELNRLRAARGGVVMGDYPVPWKKWQGAADATWNISDHENDFIAEVRYEWQADRILAAVNRQFAKDGDEIFTAGQVAALIAACKACAEGVES